MRSEVRGMRQPNPREVSEANEPRGIPPPLGRAEQRSCVRIKALALSERSEFASAPNAASSARNPKGTDVARLFLLTFFGEAKKVSRPPGRDPASHRRKTQPANQTPSLLPHGQPQGLPLRPSLLIPHKARHAVHLRGCVGWCREVPGQARNDGGGVRGEVVGVRSEERRGMVWVMGAALPCTCRHAARSRSIYVGVQGNMDSATARGMTKFGYCRCL